MFAFSEQPKEKLVYGFYIQGKLIAILLGGLYEPPC